MTKNPAAPCTVRRALAIGTMLLLASGTAGCHSGTSAPERSNDTVASTGRTAGVPDSISQPWWQKVSMLRGDGNGTTGTFEISPRAVQWRVTWRCEAGSFSMQPARPAGTERLRPLVDEARCSTQGDQAFTNKTGPFILTVTASSPWQVEIEQQVDTQLVEEAIPAMSSPATRIVAAGPFYGIDRTATGTAKLYALPDGTNVLRLEDFFVTATVDLQLRLTPVPAPHSTADVADAPFKNVAFLKATAGAMNFPVPSDIDVTKYGSLVIWCEMTHNAYGAAALAP